MTVFDSHLAKERIWFWLVLATAVATATLFYFAPNKNIGSDPKYTLVVSRAILHDGSIRLDNQLSDFDNFRITEIQGHHYYTFPYGTSLIVTPFVWAAEKLGHDVRQFPDEVIVQKWLLAATGAILVLLCWAILHTYLAPNVSWMLTLVLVWGSVLASTFGSALWNLNLTVLLILAAIWLLVQHHSGNATTVRPILLGLLLFFAFLCRPTASVFIVIVFLYLLIWNRREIWLTAGVALLGLIGFMLYNQAVMGQPLPPYYLPQRLESRTPFAWAFWGLLFSPSRGLFVFSPVLLYMFVWGMLRFKTIERQTRQIMGLILLWFVVYLIVIARFDHWWGGFSYGPRLLTGLMPAVVWLTAVAWPHHPHNQRHPVLSNTIFTLLVVFSIYSHLYVGLFDTTAYAWNGTSLPPNIDRAPQYLFDWRYPQFLATETQLCQRHDDFMSQLRTQNRYILSTYPSGYTMLAKDGAVLATLGLHPAWMKSERAEIRQVEPASFLNHTYLPMVASGSPLYFLPQGWNMPADGRMKSACAPATLMMGTVESTLLSQSWQGSIVLESEAEQTVQIFVNNQPVTLLDLQESQTSYTFTIPPNTFSSMGENQIQIIPSSDEKRTNPQVWDAPPIYFYGLTLRDGI
ncbi:MAG: hypothetical protein H6662_04120 [Ardenticatenaceae bacterium]|nr:hypothetical protein [Anaerolineales bacterium]MCB8920750.1 hypothetical protein [Ardenticatenaceae bacterium]MCB8989709.1 hypothetical protein [Ardenticatenaceae bacterium]MCB9002832.1 hypothetical protein [Ardenticatenaceae bacterium]